MMAKLKSFLRRTVNRLIHRYIVVSITAFLVSRYWIFNNQNYVSDNRLVFAVLSLFFITLFLGKRGAMYSCFICIGFLFSMLFYGEKHFFDVFLYQYSFTPSLNVFIAWICLAVSPLMLTISFISICKSKKRRYQITRNDLYSERWEKFDAISRYISNHSVVGINSPYGNGKSTIVEALKSQKSDWEFITISLLSTTVENVEYCIVREIERVLEFFGIFSNPISKIKSFFSHDFSFCIGELLFENQSYDDQIKDFVDDIRCLKKVIVLNFEDIDRISDKKHVKKIFAICDSLLKFELKFPAEDRYIKVIYQCNIDALNDMFKEDSREWRYVEKFIPYTFSLDPLTGEFFKNVLKKNQKKYKEIENIRFDFLNVNMKYNLLQQEALYSFFGHSVRGVEQVLDNVNSTFERDYDLSVFKQQDVEPVIIFYIAKYFLPHVYELLDEKCEMVNQAFFYDNDEKLISFTELRNRFLVQKENEKSIYGAMSFKTVCDVFFSENNKNSKKNREALLFLILLGYNDEYFNEKSNTAEKYNVMKRKEEILNRMIRLS